MVCLFPNHCLNYINYIFSQLNLSLDDAEDELKRRKGNYGDSPESVRVLLEKQKEWEPQLKVCYQKILECV